MTENQKNWLAAAVYIGTFIIPEIDAAYITSRMKESGLRMEVQCHDEPNNCWIQKRSRK